MFASMVQLSCETVDAAAPPRWMRRGSTMAAGAALVIADADRSVDPTRWHVTLTPTDAGRVRSTLTLLQPHLSTFHTPSHRRIRNLNQSFLGAEPSVGGVAGGLLLPVTVRSRQPRRLRPRQPPVRPRQRHLPGVRHGRPASPTLWPGSDLSGRAVRNCLPSRVPQSFLIFLSVFFSF